MRGEPILVDTDVLVDCLRGYPPAVGFLGKAADRVILSAVVVAELYAGIKDPHEEATLDALVSRFPVLPVTADIARAAGLLKRDFGKSHGVGLPDAIVAATARAQKAELATLNIRHYPMLTGIAAPYSKR